MSYVWTAEQVERYRDYYKDIRTHHSYTYARFQTSKEFVRSVLPPCLEVPDACYVTVSFMTFMEWVHGTVNRQGRDRASIIGVNAKYEDKEGNYYLTVLETEEVNVVTGREFWGMPKKIGNIEFFDDGETFFGFGSRKDFSLIELVAQLGEVQSPSENEETEYYFDLRAHMEVNASGINRPQLVVFKNSSLTKRAQAIKSASITLSASPFDPGVGTIPLGDFVDGGHIGGETSYIIESVVELDSDGNDYTPYLMGRLYDDWPDVRSAR